MAASSDLVLTESAGAQVADPAEIDPSDNAGEFVEDPSPARGLPVWLASALGGLGGVLVIALIAGLLLGNNRAPSRVVGAAAAGAAANGTPLYEAPAIGYLAPQFTLAGLDGKTYNLKEFQGRPVWVNIWATWCPPCRAEMPEMKRIYAKYKDQGLALIGVDFAESPDTVQNFVSQNGYDWTFVLDRDARVAGSYNATGIPTHAFVDATGVVRAYTVGGLSPEAMEAGMATILPK